MPTSLEGGIAGGGVTGGKGEVGGGGEGAENGLMRTFGAERDSTVTPTIVESACGVIELRVATAALPTESDGETMVARTARLAAVMVRETSRVRMSSSGMSPLKAAARCVRYLSESNSSSVDETIVEKVITGFSKPPGSSGGGA